MVLEGVNQALEQNGGTLLEFIGDEAPNFGDGGFPWQILMGFFPPDIKMWHPTTTTGDRDGKGEDFGDFNAWRSPIYPLVN